MRGAAFVGWLVLVSWLSAQSATEDLRAFVANDKNPSDERCRKLAVLQDEGALDVPTVLIALRDADEALSRMAAAIVRHEWVELPITLLQGLDASPKAARLLLEELAIAPRPAAATWAETWTHAAPRRTADDRCLALAARGWPLAAADADFLLRTLLAGQADDGFGAAAAVLPPAVADGLLGRLHACLMQEQLDVTQVGPLLDRLSPDACRRLLGLVVTLPAAAAAAICQRVAERDPAIVRERARAMLDGETPLEALWLAYAGPLLDRPERVERVLRVLGDEQATPLLRARAFDALLDAKVVDDRVLDFATAEGADPALAQRLLDATVALLPEARLVLWLDGDPRLSTATVKALTRRLELGASIEKALLGTLGDGSRAEGPFFESAAMAIVQHGSEAALDRIWPALREAPRWPDFVDALTRRREPFVHELLVAELVAPMPAGLEAAVGRARRDAVRLALVTLGDRRQLGELVANAKVSPATFVRRCAHHARPLALPFALSLLDETATIADADLAAEMVAWAATAPDAQVQARLQQIWAAPIGDGTGELQEVALRALVGGPGRDQLVTELRRAIAAGPLPERLEPLTYEVTATMPQPLAAADLRLLAELVLLPPLTDPEREAQQVQRWPDGRFGFPLAAAIAQRLRGSEPAAVTAAFATVVREVLQDPRHKHISRQRLTVVWRSLEADHDVQTAVGIATAPLLLAVPGTVEVGTGPAHWFLLQEAEARSDFAVAATHARAALAALLRMQDERRTARLFLGERDPGAGQDPWAALAAAPHRLTFRMAQAAGDAAAANAAALRVREFAGHDVGTLASTRSTNTQELVR